MKKKKPKQMTPPKVKKKGRKKANSFPAKALSDD
jgi:hypothetical protein